MGFYIKYICSSPSNSCADVRCANSNPFVYFDCCNIEECCVNAQVSVFFIILHIIALGCASFMGALSVYCDNLPFYMLLLLLLLRMLLWNLSYMLKEGLLHIYIMT